MHYWRWPSSSIILWSNKPPVWVISFFWQPWALLAIALFAHTANWILRLLSCYLWWRFSVTRIVMEVGCRQNNSMCACTWQTSLLGAEEEGLRHKRVLTKWRRFHCRTLLYLYSTWWCKRLNYYDIAATWLLTTQQFLWVCRWANNFWRTHGYVRKGRWWQFFSHCIYLVHLFVHHSASKP